MFFDHIRVTHAKLSRHFVERMDMDGPGPILSQIRQTNQNPKHGLVLADCSLRQGAGGTEFARFGSRTCFLR